jgi:hypothetical protein
MVAPVGFPGAQTALYAGYLKKQGLVTEGRKAQGKTQAERKGARAQSLVSSLHCYRAHLC